MLFFIGPGATNMVTGAASATITRLLVLLLPGDVLSTGWPTRCCSSSSSRPPRTERERRVPAGVPVPSLGVRRPEQLPSALLAAMPVLTDPAETGAVTLAVLQDVQAQAYAAGRATCSASGSDIPWMLPDPVSATRAAEVIRSARRPLIVAGGGVIYSEAMHALKSFADAFGIPVGHTQAGKGTMRFETRCARARSAPPGPPWRSIAARADAVIGIGTRWSDFTTASRSLSAEPGVRSSTSTWRRSTRRSSPGWRW